jgi:hypothetical protein
MASMRPAALKGLVRAGHLIRFRQKHNIDCLLEQLFSSFKFPALGFQIDGDYTDNSRSPARGQALSRRSIAKTLL